MKEVGLSVLMGIGLAVGLAVIYVAFKAAESNWAIIKLPF